MLSGVGDHCSIPSCYEPKIFSAVWYFSAQTCISNIPSNNRLQYGRSLYSILQARVYSEIAQLISDAARTETRIPDFGVLVSEPQDTGLRSLLPGSEGWRHNQCAMLCAPGNQQLSSAPQHLITQEQTPQTCLRDVWLNFTWDLFVWSQLYWALIYIRWNSHSLSLMAFDKLYHHVITFSIKITKHTHKTFPIY